MVSMHFYAVRIYYLTKIPVIATEYMVQKSRQRSRQIPITIFVCGRFFMLELRLVYNNLR